MAPQRPTRQQALAGSTLLLMPSLAFLVALLLAAGPDDLTQASDPRCESADRAAVTRIRDALGQQDRRSTRELERGVSVLAAARTHCAIGAVERGLAEYAALDRALSR